MLSGYAKREWSTIMAIGVLLSIAAIVAGVWPVAILVVLLAAGAVAFFRDPQRYVPTQRGLMVSPADGRISSIHQVEHFEPFDGPAVCVRIFMSVLDVHVNRSPCHGLVESVTHKPGDHLNALNPDSAEVNESVLMVLLHPTGRHPLAAVRQVAGILARTIVCRAAPDIVLQRGQRFGIIKLGSTVELYVPAIAQPRVVVEQGQYVHGGVTVLVHVGAASDRAQPAAAPAQPAPTAAPDNAADADQSPAADPPSTADSTS